MKCVLLGLRGAGPVPRPEEAQGAVHRLDEGHQRSKQQAGIRVLSVPLWLVRRIPLTYHFQKICKYCKQFHRLLLLKTPNSCNHFILPLQKYFFFLGSIFRECKNLFLFLMGYHLSESEIFKWQWLMEERNLFFFSFP